MGRFLPCSCCGVCQPQYGAGYTASSRWAQHGGQWRICVLQHWTVQQVSVTCADLTKKKQKHSKIYYIFLPICTAGTAVLIVWKVNMPGHKTSISASLRRINGSFDCTRCFIDDNSRACFSCREGRGRDKDTVFSWTRASISAVRNFREWGPNQEKGLLRSIL